MADTRNPREVVDIGKFKPYTHPQHGAGAIREVVYIDGTVERRFFHHGTQKDGEGAPDEGYLVDTRVDTDLRDKWIKNAPPEARADSRTPEQRQKDEADARNAVELQRQREKNAALPADQDPRYETDKERADRAASTVKEQEAAAEKERQRARQEQQDAEAKAERERQAQRQAAADARAEADRNRPGAPTLKPDGKGGTIAVQTMPDGTIKTTPLPGVPSDKPAPDRVTVDGTVYERGEDGVYKPASGLPVAGQVPKDTPSFTPDLTKPGAGLVERAKQLDELMAAGKLTWEQRQAILQQDVQTAQTVAGEFNSAATVLREDYQQRVSQRSSDMTQSNNRANLANTYVQNAQGLVEKFAPYLGATPGDAGKLFVGMMASQLAQATMMGGMDTVAREEMDPRLRSWIDSRMPGAPGAAVPPGPGQAVAAGVAATAAAGANPTGQNVQAATDATMQGSNAAFGALGVPPVEQAPVAAPAPLPSFTDPNTGQFGIPGSFVTGPYQQTPQEPVGMGLPAPMAGGNAMAGEALFGKTLPEPQSWRQGAEQQAFALTMPQQQQAGVGEALFGGSLPQWQAPAMPDYSLPPIQGAGGMDPIDAEARRQLAAAGVLV